MNAVYGEKQLFTETQIKPYFVLVRHWEYINYRLIHQIKHYNVILSSIGANGLLKGLYLSPKDMLQINLKFLKTKNRIILTKQSGRPLKLKVVIRCRKK